MKITITIEEDRNKSLKAEAVFTGASLDSEMKSRIQYFLSLVRPITQRKSKPQTYPDYIMINSVGPNKIAMIKLVREVTGLGLKEAKDLVESPLPIKLNIKPELVEKVLEDLKQIGAQGY